MLITQILFFLLCIMSVGCLALAIIGANRRDPYKKNASMAILAWICALIAVVMWPQIA